MMKELLARLQRIEIRGIHKRLLPQSLFGRALLILVLPTVLVQLVAAYIFYERHWENVSRWMAVSLAGEISLLVHELNDATPEKREELVLFADRLMAMQIRLDDTKGAKKFLRAGEKVAPAFFNELNARLGQTPFSVALTDDQQDLEIRVKLHDAILHINVTRKRLVSATTTIFITAMFGSAFVLLGVAVMFLRNQIRPITKLAGAMDEFGKGHETPGFRPQGAEEVRKAGRAFISMKQRLERLITARMEMLAGISHDLRTPLTRMKLELEMLRKSEAQAALNLQCDVTDMERMIEEYLDFVRGEGGEIPTRQGLIFCLEDILERYRRQGHDIALYATGMAPIEVDIRPHVFRRAMSNIIDNALRYGHSAEISVNRRHQHVEIWVDDKGPGIPLALREEVFKPFKRLEESRNVQKGGVGLGLAITRDIIHAHGGDVILLDAPSGGLRVSVRLPIPPQN